MSLLTWSLWVGERQAHCLSPRSVLGCRLGIWVQCSWWGSGLTPRLLPVPLSSGQLCPLWAPPRQTQGSGSESQEDMA